MNPSFTDEKICRQFYKEISVRVGAKRRVGKPGHHMSHYVLDGYKNMRLVLPLVTAQGSLCGETSIELRYGPAVPLGVLIAKLQEIQAAGKKLLETEYANVDNRKALVEFFS